MRKDRLLLLANHLDTILEENFDMMAWKCESKSCAMGHACDIPEFQAAGLQAIQHNGWLVPAFEGSIGFEAAAKLFEISSYEAIDLFDERTCDIFGPKRTPTNLATEIRDFVTRKLPN